MSNYADLNIDQLWERATVGEEEEAIQELVLRFDKVIVAQSRISGRIDEDIVQDIREKFICAIRADVVRERNNDTSPPDSV